MKSIFLSLLFLTPIAFADQAYDLLKASDEGRGSVQEGLACRRHVISPGLAGRRHAGARFQA